MHIIIVGCGKVGSTLAEQLQEEDTDLTLIDTDADVINNLTEDIDAMGIVGMEPASIHLWKPASKLLIS